MSNILKDSMKETIRELGERGWSHRRIARELNVHRKTVRKYLSDDPKCTISTTGKSGEVESKGTISTTGKIGRQSKCTPHDTFIREGLKKGFSAQRIHQDLQEDKGFEGSYESVKRYVQKLSLDDDVPFRRMEVLPGTECQVDYGTGAWIIDENGKRRKTHLFRVTLSFSRKGYSEVTFQQSSECFLRALENAFRFFGGVPEIVVIDNLKAGVIKPDVYDPELNPKLRDFAAHYGTCIMPTRSYTPRHKGKVERQVGYVQDNALKARKFGSLAEQNLFLRDWESKVADQRIHGTVRRQVAVLFAEEKPMLKPLPMGLFPAFSEGRRKVHRDGHVEVNRAYYSVPAEYTRREVWVRFDGRMVEVFNLKMEQLTVHAQKNPGEFSTRNEHIPKEKISRPERGNEWMLNKAAMIGEEAHAWAKAMLQNRGIPGVRVLNGLLSLPRTYPVEAINAGSRKALEAGEFRLKELKQYIENAHRYEQPQFEFIGKHPLIRDIESYEQASNTKGLFT